MNEIWRDVLGYEGYYKVSNFGKVKSVDRIVVRSDNIKQLVKERMLKPGKDTSGYVQVHLCKGGKFKTVSVHRLVAIAFIDREDEAFEVNHKDENKSNNSIENLEWISRIDNLRYGTGIERGAISCSKPVVQMDLNKNIIKIWKSGVEVERTLGFCQTYISMVCLGKRKRAYGFRWGFAK